MRVLDRLITPPGPVAGTVTLSFERRARSRARVTLNDGSEALIALPRASVLRAGDVLADATGQGVRVLAAPEAVSVAHGADAGARVRAAYHLGNRHVPVQIGPDWLAWPHDHVLDAMVRGLGLVVGAAHQPFEPEPGAYGAGHAPGAGSGHGHGHAHVHDAGHGHAPEHAHGTDPALAPGHPHDPAHHASAHSHGDVHAHPDDAR